jgi:hypothetical protein
MSVSRYSTRMHKGGTCLGSRDPFPRTPALSPGRGRSNATLQSTKAIFDSPCDRGRFSLSPGERAGVRGNGASGWSLAATSQSSSHFRA